MIASPSIVPRMPARDYRAAAGVSQSLLRELARSPLHAKWAMEHPKEATPAMLLGSAVHHALLSPWDDEPVITNAYVDRRDAMVAAIKGHKPAWNALGGECELSIFADARALHDTLPPLAVKGRLDCHLPGIAPDLKTCADASPKGFAKAAWDRGYYTQAAFYLDLARAAGLEADSFLWICVESQPPHAVALYYAGAESWEIEHGRQQYRELLARFYACQTSGEWPGYATEPQELTAPSYARRPPAVG